MSEKVNEFTIRAGSFHGPISLLTDNARMFQKTLHSFNLPTEPEEIVDVSNYLKGMEEITRFAGDDDFFARAGYVQKVEDLGVFGRAIVSADTLWDALQIAKSALLYYQSDSELVIRTYKKRCHIWYFNPFEAFEGAKDVQYTITLLANVVCLANNRTDPDIDVSYPNGCSTHVLFNSAISRVRASTQGYISFDEEALKSQMSKMDALRAEVFSRYLADESIKACEKPLTKDIVAGLVRASFGVAPWSLVNTCGALQLHERTLQLRLKSEGTSFREIVQTERHLASKRLLVAGKDIVETAEILGFEHRQSFSEAFSRWEGLSPSAFTSRV